MDCELCGKHEDERNIQEQGGYYLCLSCDCTHSDNELENLLEEFQRTLAFKNYGGKK